MHIARTIFVAIGTSLLLWSGAALVVANNGSPAPIPLQTPPLSVTQLAIEPAISVLMVSTPEPHVPLELADAERDLVEWAHARFELVDLDLPPVDISFHENTEPCDGSDGIYRNEGDRPRVRVCIPDRGTFASDLERQRTLVHELAHAWEQANLDDASRQGLLETLDADGWYAPDSAWDERGAERFAETIVWGLYDQLRRPTLIDVPCRELHADFRTITGHTAPGPLERVCTLDAALG